MDLIYQKLIERIPDDLVAEEIALGELWLVVRSTCRR